MNMLSLFPAIPLLMMLGLWLSKSTRQIRAVMVAGSSLLLLLAALRLGIVKLEQVKEVGLFLTGIFPLLFVPAAAGVMDLWAELHAMLLPVLIALVPVTFLVMATAGRVTQRFAKAEPELEEELANDDAQ